MVLQEFDYFPETGEFFRRRRRGRSKKGSRVGWVSKNGYRRTGVAGASYTLHDLVWFLEKDEFPPSGHEIDHIDGNRDNNVISNLRLATRSQNCANSRLRKNNKTGVRGVYFDPKRNRYCVQVYSKVIEISEKRTVKRFLSLEEAALCANLQRKKIWGKFALCYNPDGTIFDG